MAAREWSLAEVHEVVAAAAPERDMLVWKGTRRTYAEVAARVRSVAGFLSRRGVGIRRERAALERWECGQSPVALLLYNCPEYIEAMLGCFRARAVPFNVNQHYRPAEIRSLLGMLGADAVVYHRALGPLLRDSAELDRLVLVDVDDGSGVPPLEGSTSFEEAARKYADAPSLPAPSPDDLYLVCTGGTTGSPKGVLWRQGDIFVAAMRGTEGATRESLAAQAATGVGTWFAAPPLMHAAAQWTAFAALHCGGTLVLHDDSAPFDARTILETLARERVNLMSIVGDAFARRLIEELRARRYDVSSLHTLATGGAVTSEAAKEALFELLPDVTIVDGYGASETGGMAYGATRRGVKAGGFAGAAGAAVLSGDRSRFLAPGDEEIGWTARRGRVPLGYLGDRRKTEETFPIIDGERLAVPGDRARLTREGTIALLGRDSLVINTGGEKVFVEEVEDVLRRHPDVVDALVVGRPSERFGEEVVGVVQLRPGATPDAAALREFAAQSIARFKAPRAIAFCERVQRHASGKGDYRWAKSVAEGAVAAAR
jgi:fatty-acyl-CoA synthase